MFHRNDMKYIYFTLLLVAMLLPSGYLHGTPVIVSGGPENDYEGWIARLSDNRLMVVFTRNPDWASGDLYVTFSPDSGATWDSVIPIIVENDDQATLSFVQLPDDTLCLWYASNEDGQYGIYEARSFDALSWIRRGRIELGWSQSDMYYDPTVILEPDSSLTMSYRGPGGAYIAHRPYGQEWDTLKTMVNAGGYRPRIMKHTNGTYLYVYHRNTGGGYEVFSRTSTDRITWTSEVQLTSQGNSHDPFANQTPDLKYLVYYATYIPPAYNLYCRASIDGSNWETEEQITMDISNNTQPHFFIESNEVYLLWAHAVNYPNDHDVYFERTAYAGAKEATVPTLVDKKISFSLNNPCKNKITFHLSSSQDQDVEINFFNILGEKIDMPIKAHLTKACVYSMNTVELPAGICFIKVSYGQQDEIVKAVVIK